MNNVIDEVLAGEPRYNIKDNNGTSIYSNVQIDLATQVTTAGTPLNKALFDSIKTDLNSRLLISNKATGNDVKTGTNDTKYITPLANKQGKQNLVTTTTLYATGSAVEQTIFDFSTASGSIVEISGTYGENTTTNEQTIYLNGTYINGVSQNGLSISNYDFRYVAQNKGCFYFRFDLANKTFVAFFSARKSGNTTLPDYVVGRFTTLTTMTTILRGTASQNTYISATISQNY